MKVIYVTSCQFEKLPSRLEELHWLAFNVVSRQKKAFMLASEGKNQEAQIADKQRTIFFRAQTKEHADFG